MLTTVDYMMDYVAKTNVKPFMGLWVNISIVIQLLFWANGVIVD